MKFFLMIFSFAYIQKITSAFTPTTETIFTLFTVSNPKIGEKLSMTDGGTSLTASNYNELAPTRFITHGWLNDATSPVNIVIRDAYLKKGQFNVIVVDWGKGAFNPNYFQAALSVDGVGEVVANMVKFLRQQSKETDPLDITLVGHSLGAHVAGSAGRRLDPKVQNIVALDPANPAFGTTYLRLTPVNPGDAIYVQSIHTNRGVLGRNYPCGHASFYPNYGPKQPGCEWDFSFTCDHGRSYYLFAESINTPSPGFPAMECEGGFDDIWWFECVPNGTAIMGGEPLDRGASGVYYMSTKGYPPFTKGYAGM